MAGRSAAGATAVHRPRILVTTSTQFRNEGLRRRDSLTGSNYSEGVIRAGGLPFMVANLNPDLADAYLDNCDGVLFSGGGDLDPHHYGQRPGHGLGRVDPQRDAFELAVYRRAREREIPVLGVCRGIQLINVAAGGTLHQHLPDIDGTLQHSQVDIDGEPIHRVELEPDSHLARRLAQRELRVNSYHHQAIDRLGNGLRVVARSEDGVIEAIEATEGGFVLGVEWHPELSFSHYPEQLLPFEILIERAEEQQLGSSRSD